METHHEKFERSFPTMSLASDGSLSDIHETCQQCGKLFENELDVQNHVERVHEYGELYQLYPCEECGLRASDLLELRKHTDEGHGNVVENSFEALGIRKLPVITKRRKQNFSDLQIDDNGIIDIDDDFDDDFISSEEELLLVEESDWETNIPETVTERRSSKRKAKTTEVAIKRKRMDKVVPEKGSKSKDGIFQCEVCATKFSRKDNMLRHVKNKH